MPFPTPFNRLVATSPTANAVTLMVVASALLSGQHGIVRHLASDLHPFEIVFFRNLFGFAIFVPWLIKVRADALRTQRFGTHALRAVLNGCSLMAYFMALSLIPLANATALFLSVPLFVTLGAILFLGESVGLPRWIALAVGMSGALVIIRPGFVDVGTGSVLVIVGATFAASTRLLAKSLSRTDSSATIVAYVTLLMTPLTLIPAAFVWRWPDFAEIPWLFAVGVLGSLGQLSFVKAYSLVDISFAEPMAFTRLVWAVIIGFLAFSEIPDIWTWLGGAMIVAAITYLTRGVGSR